MDKDKEEALARLKARIMFTIKRRKEVINNAILERRTAIHKQIRHRRYLYHKYERMQMVCDPFEWLAFWYRLRCGGALTLFLIQTDLQCIITTLPCVNIMQLGSATCKLYSSNVSREAKCPLLTLQHTSILIQCEKMRKLRWSEELIKFSSHTYSTYSRLYSTSTISHILLWPLTRKDWKCVWKSCGSSFDIYLHFNILSRESLRAFI